MIDKFFMTSTLKSVSSILLAVLLYLLQVNTALAQASLAGEDDADAALYENQVEDYSHKDPFEKFNRSVFAINKGLDKVILKPVATVYDKGVPDFVTNRIHNALLNLSEPVNILNAILQLDPDKFTKSMGRFVMNSSLGLLGLHDVAGKAGIPYSKNGFDTTLAHYGLNTGPYLVIPVYGPSSVRGLTGLAIDTVSDPLFYFNDKVYNYVRTGLYIVDTRAGLLDATDLIEKTSLDEYSSYRSLYFQQNAMKETKNASK